MGAAWGNTKNFSDAEHGAADWQFPWKIDKKTNAI